jgi:heptosyltransferase-3
VGAGFFCFRKIEVYEENLYHCFAWSLMPQSPQRAKPKILIIALKFMGDLIVAAPSIEALRRKFPDCHLTVLLRKGLEEIFLCNQAVDEVLAFDYPAVRRSKGWKRLAIELSWARTIRRRRFEIVICLQPGDRFALWAWLAGGRMRVGPKKQPFGFLFNVPVDVEEGGLNFREYYGKMVAAVGVDTQQTSYKYDYPLEADEWAEAFIRDHEIKLSNDIVGIHPGSRDPVKMWPAENFARLAECLLQTPRTSIILIQGPNEAETIERLQQMSQSRLVVADCSSHISYLAAVIKRCRLYIGNDSGPRHLAAAVGTSTLTLMHSAKLKTWKVYDESEGHFVLTDKVENPESDRAYHESSTINTLSSISVDEVIEKLRWILRR